MTDWVVYRLTDGRGLHDAGAGVSTSHTHTLTHTRTHTLLSCVVVLDDAQTVLHRLTDSLTHPLVCLSVCLFACLLACLFVSIASCCCLAPSSPASLSSPHPLVGMRGRTAQRRDGRAQDGMCVDAFELIRLRAVVSMSVCVSIKKEAQVGHSHTTKRHY